MAHAIEFVKDTKYVGVALTGEITKNDLEIARNEANLALTANNCNRILVDATRSNPRLSVLELFEFEKEHRLRFPLGVRIALVVPPDRLENLRFAENVAQNRGVNMNLFLDRAQALNWLLERSS